MRVYEIKCTEDALKLGKIASKHQLRILAILRESNLKKAKKAMELGLLNESIVWATKAQFCREAIESAEGKY